MVSGLSNLKGKSGLTGLKLTDSMYGSMSSKSMSMSKPSSSGTTGGHSNYSLEARRRRRRRRLVRARRKDEPAVTSKYKPLTTMSVLAAALPKIAKKKPKPKPKQVSLNQLLAALSLKK